MFCKKCGTELPDSVKFCVTCGSPVVMAEPEDDEKTVYIPSTPAPETDEEPTTVYLPQNEPAPAPQPEPEPEPQPEPAPAPQPEPQPQPQPVPPVHQYADPVNTFTPPVKKKKKIWPVILIIVLVLVIGAGVGGFLFFTARANAALYEEAQTLLTAKDYDGAMAKLEELGGYEDAEEILAELTEQKADYADAQALLTEKDYEGAKAAFKKLGDYADSADMAASGVDYQKGLYLMECAAASDAAGLEVLYTEGDYAVSDDATDIAVSLYNGAAEQFLALGDYSDSAAKAMECYYAAGILEAERQDYDAALGYKDLMDETTAETYYNEFLTYCADGTILADLEAALQARVDMASSGSDYYILEELIQVELDILEPYLEQYFADTELQTYVALYMEGLYYQLSAVNVDWDAIEDEVLWYTGAALRMQTIDALNETYGFLNNNSTLAAEVVGQADLAWSYAYISEILNNQLIGYAPSVDSSGNYYLPLENTTAYDFDLEYVIECYEGNTCVFSSDTMVVNVPSGESVAVPLEFPENGDWDWYIWWDFYNIYMDGEQLD